MTQARVERETALLSNLGMPSESYFLTYLVGAKLSPKYGGIDL